MLNLNITFQVPEKVAAQFVAAIGVLGNALMRNVELQERAEAARAAALPPQAARKAAGVVHFDPDLAEAYEVYKEAELGKGNWPLTIDEYIHQAEFLPS